MDAKINCDTAISETLKDGEILDKPHFHGYTLRAIRHNENVEIWHIFPSGTTISVKQIPYSEYLQKVIKYKCFYNAFGLTDCQQNYLLKIKAL